MKEDWTDRIRQELERFEMTPPEGLWEDICKQMDMPAEPVSASHKRWYWAVAAAVLALVGFFAVYLYEDHSEPSVLIANCRVRSSIGARNSIGLCGLCRRRKASDKQANKEGNRLS